MINPERKALFEAARALHFALVHDAAKDEILMNSVCGVHASHAWTALPQEVRDLFTPIDELARDIRDKKKTLSVAEHVFLTDKRVLQYLNEDFVPTHVHRKGGKYRKIGEAFCSENPEKVYVVYEDDPDLSGNYRGKMWVRPIEEFNDGRFQPYVDPDLVIPHPSGA